MRIFVIVDSDGAVIYTVAADSFPEAKIKIKNLLEKALTYSKKVMDFTNTKNFEASLKNLENVLSMCTVEETGFEELYINTKKFGK